MKTILTHILLWILAAIACVMIGGCKKEHPIDLDWNLKYQRKDRAKTIHPYPWTITGYYYPRDPKAQNWYNLVDAEGGKLNCIDRDLEEWGP